MAIPIPCRRCGGKPHIESGGYRTKYCHFTHTCKKIKPPIHTHSAYYATRKDAIEAWNNHMLSDYKEVSE